MLTKSFTDESGNIHMEDEHGWKTICFKDNARLATIICRSNPELMAKIQLLIAQTYGETAEYNLTLNGFGEQLLKVTIK